MLDVIDVVMVQDNTISHIFGNPIKLANSNDDLTFLEVPLQKWIYNYEDAGQFLSLYNIPSYLGSSFNV